MSKESKPRDLWRQLYESLRDRPATWCQSCGWFAVVHSPPPLAACTGCGAPLTERASIARGWCLECRLEDPSRDARAHRDDCAVAHPDIVRPRRLDRPVRPEVPW